MRVVVLALLTLLMPACKGGFGAAPASSYVRPIGERTVEQQQEAKVSPDHLTTEEACAIPQLGEQPLRRLSSEQYKNTVRDLFGAGLGDQVLQGSVFPDTLVRPGAFAGDAEVNAVNSSDVEAIQNEAERIAEYLLNNNVDANMRALMPCALGASFTDANVDGCIDGFIAAFGKRAYRRPLAAAEATMAKRVYDAVRSQGARTAWSAVVQFFVEAPAMLYRVERGSSSLPDHPEWLALDDWEVASRLSYMFLGSMPDDTLLAQAAAGALHTREQVEAEARRLAASPRFAQAYAAFHRDWLQMGSVADMSKDPQFFPEMTAQVRASMAQEAERFAGALLTSGNGNVKNLLSNDTFYVDNVLAAYYGVSAPGAGAGVWVAAKLPHRSGLLTSGAFMAVTGRRAATSPMHRGALLRSTVLCQPTPTLPGDIDTATVLVSSAGSATARQRFQPLLDNPTCGGCHTQFNPLGLAFESYDAIGRWRDTENGTPIDTSAAVDLGPGVTTYANLAELISAAADSPMIANCYSLQWFRASLGRHDTAADGCSTHQVYDVMASSSGDLTEMLVAITQTDTFLGRLPPVQ